MKHRYLTIDGELGGTGVRDEFKGFIELDKIPLSNGLKKQITEWVDQYPSSVIGRNLPSNNEISQYDIKGIELMRLISIELGPEYKLRYYSDLKCKELKEIKGGTIIEL
ncbi:hypothetical protein QWY85_00305 [Neolewinella lacunae]|uniref:Uncharacterized protein n=1 Tax=Neolewinella lacunae TaxID=1517758 RepID=A0A923T9A7_9BACT|nr:hypothetical protein [Neolewinella lacunae]MBC6995366.1 hypothetical protein [Neolewinella lacunae]MDN3633078.1 hypothetical protein [Neolewinella lacunae]